MSIRILSRPSELGATFPTPCTRARARHACRSNIDSTAAATAELFGRVYVQSRYCFAARRPRRGSKQYLSHAPPSLCHPPIEATHHPAGSLLQKPFGERGAPRGGAGWRGGGLLRPSVSSRLVSRDGLVSRQPSSVRIDTPATLTTPTSSTFYCEKQCTYRPRSRSRHLQPRPPPPPPPPHRRSHLLRARAFSPSPLFLLSLWLLPPASAR